MKREKSPHYWVTLKHTILTADGVEKAETLRVQYRRVTQSDLESIGQRIERGELTDAGVIDQYVNDWAGPTEDDDTAIKWADVEARNSFLNDMPGLTADIVRGFFRSQPGAKPQKN